MHSLTASFVLGYHGRDEAVADKLLRNEPFEKSENKYDWLGSGIYFWESNPDRALAWARERAKRKGGSYKPGVVGAVINPGFCLDLISTNGITAVEQAHAEYIDVMNAAHIAPETNEGGDDLLRRNLDCDVLNFLHASRKENDLPKFDTVRGVFVEGKPIYRTAGFCRKTHIQICVRDPAMIKGVFRVPKDHFSEE